jgi:catechol 2,3-dioxygenase-like lactoylglutathione lyase family enzyme
MLKQVQPVLPCKSVSETIQFYVEKLGFTLAFADGEEPSYAGVRRDDVEVHLQRHDASEWGRVERPHLRFLVTDIDVLYSEFKEKRVLGNAAALGETPWGTREFGVFDPNKNGLTFYTNL